MASHHIKPLLTLADLSRIGTDIFCLSHRSNIKPLLAIDMPNCFGHQQPYSCDQTASDSVTYVEVCAGMAQGFVGGMQVCEGVL